MKSPNEWPPCSKRQQLTIFEQDRSKKKIQKCTEKKAEKYGLEVLESDCEACPVRSEVTRLSMQAGEWKPPLIGEVANVRGARRDTDPAPGWLPCVDRNIVTIGACCGQTGEVRVCDSVDCFRLGSEVTPSHCNLCPHRKEP